MNNIKSITPDLSQIKDNTPALKIGDKYFACGIGGNFIPAGQGASMSFYKCASVGTGTWSGYLASVDPVTGIWSFSATTVERPIGRITPVVGHVYDEDCSFEVKNYKTSIPEDGLIFYLPLATEIGDTDETGHYALTKINTNYTFTTKDGIPCVQTSYGAKVIGPDIMSDLPNSSSTRLTLSFFGASTNQWGYTRTGLFYDNGTGGGTNIALGIGLRGNVILRYYNGSDTGQDYNNTTMAHFVIVYNGNTLQYYRNKVLIQEISTSTPFGSTSVIYPGFVGDDNGYIAAYRIYNRVLDSSEIAALASEFTPTVS